MNLSDKTWKLGKLSTGGGMLRLWTRLMQMTICKWLYADDCMQTSHQRGVGQLDKGQLDTESELGNNKLLQWTTSMPFLPGDVTKHSPSSH